MLRETTNTAPSIDLSALERDLNALRDRLRAEVGPADREHLEKMMGWIRRCQIAGYGTAWIAPNPISPLLMSAALFARWAMVAHHVLHRGYDKVPDMPKRWTSKGFAKGWRRWLDWPDWMQPEAWRHEHNTLHHYRLGEVADPDQPEQNLEFLRTSRAPMWLRYAVVALGACTWKVLYYPMNTNLEQHTLKQKRARKETIETFSHFDKEAWLPHLEPGRHVWLGSWLPYVAYRFGLIPLPFALLGPWAYASVLVNTALAELFTNIHAFIVIVSNHAGDDLYRFEGPIADRAEFYLRQIAGSTNYANGNDLIDFLHGWLNYQIEHHLWPDMSMLQYRKAQPEVQAICEKHGVPYVQGSVWKRLEKLVDVLVGKASMPWWPSHA